MKLTCILIFFFITANVQGATFTIQLGVAGGLTFTPNSIPSVLLGDNISWVWVTGSHTSQSVTVPAGATTWANPMTSAASNFTYTPVVVGTYTYKCMPHGGLGMTGSFVVSMPLALQLLNFDMKQNSNESTDVVLEWNTAAECDNCSFIIEKSYDGVNFFEVAKEKSKTLISKSKMYNYVDNKVKLTDKIIYYRLKEEDSFGQIYILASKTFYSITSNEMRISPNPAIGSFITIKSMSFPIDRITICDLYGNIVFNTSYSGLMDALIQLDITEFRKEMYIITITAADIQTISRLVIE